MNDDKTVFVIEKANAYYHTWKIGLIILSFTSSFSYAYLASFIHLMNEDEISRANVEDTIYNILFVVDMVLQFFVERNIGNGETTQDLKRIAKEYLKGTFFMDFLTIIPFWLILDGSIDTEYSRLLYLIKLTRLYNGF